MNNATDLSDEYAALQTEHQEILREHDLLHHRPDDVGGHAAHIRRLHGHSNRLHAYLEALNATRDRGEERGSK
jgi:hypothetical protein